MEFGNGEGMDIGGLGVIGLGYWFFSKKKAVQSEE